MSRSDGIAAEGQQIKLKMGVQMEHNVQKRLAMAVKVALGVSTGLAFYGANSFAEEDASSIEEVVVTGSRIKQADFDNANPVTVISREDLLVTGMTDVGDLIQRLPSMSGSPIGTTTNNGGDGSVRVDLRGLGAGRTLNLVNGLRMVDGGDFQTIPSAMIERIEVLKDGAAAAYGADAVAGVINVITRQDFEGFEIEGLMADGFDMKDGQQQSISFIAGKAFDEGHIAFGAEFVDQSQAFQSDAPWDYFQSPTVIYPGGCENQPAAPYDGTPQGGCYFYGSSRIPEGRLNFSGLGTYMNEDGSGITPYDGRYYNYAPINYIQTPYEKTNIFASLRFNITDDIELTANVRTNDRSSAQELAPLPFNSPTDPAYDGVWNREAVFGFDLDGNGTIGTVGTGAAEVDDARSYSGISPDNYYLQQAITAAGLDGAVNWTVDEDGDPDENIGGLAGVPVSDARRRMVETNRRFEQAINQTQVDMKLTGSVTDTMSWEVFLNHGRRTGKYDDLGQFVGTNLTNAMGPSKLDANGNLGCYGDINDDATLIAGCVPFNFFGGAYSVTQEMIDYVSINLIDTTRYELDQWGAVLTGEGFELAGGSIGWAAGYEYRREAYALSKDSNKQNNGVTGNKGLSTDGSYKSDSLFVELIAPVTDNFEASLGVRYDDFSSYGDDTTAKIGLRWDVTDELAFRGTWGQVFRAPTVSDLYGGRSDSFPTAQDPCAADTPAAGCAQQSEQLDSQLLSKVGGNPGLIAETGETTTLGVVYRPTFGNLETSFTLDFWQVELEDAITRLGVQYVLNDCYVTGNTGSCGFVNRRADYSIAFVENTNYNAAIYEMSGIDFQVDANLSTDIGEWAGSLLWSHNNNYDLQSFPGDSKSDIVGRYTGSAFAEDKMNASVSWSRNNLTISYLAEYIGELSSDVTFGIYLDNYQQQIDAEVYHDVVIDYRLGEDAKTSITLGLTNITDEAPPYLDQGFNANTDPSTYRMFGSSYYLRLKHGF
jgi:iron complex outermembrane receptor protein